jgi:hypothetical protein
MDRECAKPKYTNGADCRRHLDEQKRREQLRREPAG